MVSWYIQGDLLDINSSKSIVEKLLIQSSNINAKHQVVRLLNVLSNDTDGRAYLLGQHDSSRNLSARSRVKGPEAIVRSLANALIEEGNVDSAYKQTLLGILQKLSLRYKSTN